MTNADIHRWLLFGGGALAVVAAIVMLLTSVFSQRAADDKARRAAMTGVMTAPERERAPFPYPEVEFGDSGAILVFKGPKAEPLLEFTKDNALFAEFSPEGRIQVSITIRDRSGAIVAELVKNEWKVSPGRSWDRNYNDAALEVKDASGDIVLQLVLKGNRVQLQAKLYDHAGRGFSFVKDRLPDGRSQGAIELTGAEHPELTAKIEPVFKYPSEIHFGELAARTAGVAAK